jgi:N-acetylmuramoyl-L-alanine amidase
MDWSTRAPTGRRAMRSPRPRRSVSKTGLALLAMVATLVLAACVSGSRSVEGRPPPARPSAAVDVLTSSTVPGAVVLGPTASGPFNGKVVAIDPGHNGFNWAYPAAINRLIWNGREWETCDTTGASTNAGYTESQFNWNVAYDLSRLMRVLGATVVLTRPSNTGVGPCVTTRAAIGNAVHANVAVSIHADGGPPGGLGFAILEPVADGPNNAIINSSRVLAVDMRIGFPAFSGEPISNYDGVNGLQPRDDLAGLNLSTVPKVLIETANMRNAADAARVSSSVWQEKAAQGIDAGLTLFLRGH